MKKIALVLLACVALASCGKESTTKILPTVQQVVFDDSPFITCHDWDGKDPDKVVQRAKVERPLADDRGHRKFCFVGDVCFYGCPRP